MKKLKIIFFTAIISILSSGCNNLVKELSGENYNNEEMKVFAETATIAALIGGVIGNRAARNKDSKIKDVFTAAGATVGGFIGVEIAKNRIKKLRNAKLKNSELQSVLTSARRFNSTTAQKNRQLQNEIVNLRRKLASQNKQQQRQNIQLSNKQLAEAKARKSEINTRIQDRQLMVNALDRSQQVQLQRELNTLKQENAKLDNLIAQSENINKKVRIGA